MKRTVVLLLLLVAGCEHDGRAERRTALCNVYHVGCPQEERTATTAPMADVDPYRNCIPYESDLACLIWAQLGRENYRDQYEIGLYRLNKGFYSRQLIAHGYDDENFRLEWLMGESAAKMCVQQDCWPVPLPESIIVRKTSE